MESPIGLLAIGVASCVGVSLGFLLLSGNVSSVANVEDTVAR